MDNFYFDHKVNALKITNGKTKQVNVGEVQYAYYNVRVVMLILMRSKCD